MPSQSEIYLSVAERFIAASVHSDRHAHELSGFACYHAFESIGGALVTFLGHAYPFSHKGKLNVFVAHCASRRLRYSASALAIYFNSMRNAFLYPALDNGNWRHPMSVLSQRQVQELRRRVVGIVGIVKARIT